MLKAAGQLNRRGRQRSRQKASKPTSYTATGPNQVFTWDITYLPSTVRGRYYYLYVIEDVYSRKIVGYDVYDRECGELASLLLQRTLTVFFKVVVTTCLILKQLLSLDSGEPLRLAHSS